MSIRFSAKGGIGVMERAMRVALVTAQRDDASSAVHCDVIDLTQIGQLVFATKSRFGDIDILLNNAGVPGSGSLLGISIDDWNAVAPEQSRRP
jgi:NAD(P)-dependent dehydrogenase (short-subunit alcohol dehydrogenase family)